jgi:hypothetical protein
VVNERYRSVSLPQLFVYLPPNDKARGAALIICAAGPGTEWPKVLIPWLSEIGMLK